MSKNNGGPAFPVAGSEHNYPIEGMTLRDYLAANLMPAVIGTLNGPVTCEHCPGDFDYYAVCAYQMADAMLRAREAS